MAQQLKVFIALVQDQTSASSTRVASSQGSNTLF